jgi:vacuolar-type H+-ATPase subunit E/Vma4
MDKKTEEQSVQEKNAGLIIDHIKEESGREAATIIERARGEAEKIVQDGAAETERTQTQMREALRQELEKMRERIFSSVNLEKKRIVLEEKDNFIQQVVAGVRDLAGQVRKSPGYDDFLRRAVAEGARVVDDAQVEVTYSAADEKLFLSAGFVPSLESFCRDLLKKPVALRCIKGDFDEPGVIISSVDGRIQFDNRFSSRLTRREGEIYERLLKEY